jgi:hypothetical protein
MDGVPSVYSIFIAVVPSAVPRFFPSLGIFPESYFIFTLPLLMLAIPLATLYYLLAYAQQDRRYRYKLAGALLVFLATVVVVCRVSMRVLPIAKRFRNGRHSAFPDALNLVKERLESGRMLRQTRYDLYLPPSDARNSRGTAQFRTLPDCCSPFRGGPARHSSDFSANLGAHVCR